MTPAPAERVVDALIRARLVDPAQREASIAVVAGILGTAVAPGATRRRSQPQLVEVVAYLGGALVLAAVALFCLEQWGSLPFGVQVAALAVAAVLLLVAGVVVARVPDGSDLSLARNDVRRRLSGSLLAFGALSAGLMLGQVLGRHQPLDAEIDWATAGSAVVAVVLGAAGYRLAPTTVGLVVTIGGAVTATTSLVDGVDRFEDAVAGVALFLLGTLWLAVAESGWFHQTTIARSLGAAVVLVGAQVPVLAGSHPGLGHLLTTLVVVAGVAAYLLRGAWPYLAVAVLAVTLVVPEAVAQWTDGSLGAVGGVLLAGITLLVASVAGYRLRQDAGD